MPLVQLKASYASRPMQLDARKANTMAVPELQCQAEWRTHASQLCSNPRVTIQGSAAKQLFVTQPVTQPRMQLGILPCPPHPSAPTHGRWLKNSRPSTAQSLTPRTHTAHAIQTTGSMLRKGLTSSTARFFTSCSIHLYWRTASAVPWNQTFSVGVCVADSTSTKPSPPKRTPAASAYQAPKHINK